MILSLDSLLRKVLSQANAEQNQNYPPHVYEEHINLATSWLIDEGVKLYPEKTSIIEILKPFLKKKDVKVKGGLIPLQPDHRHLLGVSIFYNPEIKVPCDRKGNFDSLCVKAATVPPTEEQIEAARLQKRAHPRKVTMVLQSEWEYLINHEYKKPTLEEPIACMFEGEGIQVYPFEVPMVEVRYIRDPKIYKYGYKMNPDETYYWDPETTTESEWTHNAETYLFKGINSLYAMWSRDDAQRDGALELKKVGLF